MKVTVYSTESLDSASMESLVILLFRDYRNDVCNL